MNTARWMRIKKKKSVRRIPLFCSSRIILEQLLELHKLRVVEVKVPCSSWCPDIPPSNGKRNYYKVEYHIVTEDEND